MVAAIWPRLHQLKGSIDGHKRHFIPRLSCPISSVFYVYASKYVHVRRWTRRRATGAKGGRTSCSPLRPLEPLKAGLHRLARARPRGERLQGLPACEDRRESPHGRPLSRRRLQPLEDPRGLLVHGLAAMQRRARILRLGGFALQGCGRMVFSGVAG